MKRQFHILALALVLQACNCSDPSTLGITSCAQHSDCRGTAGCCEGFCRESCPLDDGGARGGGAGGGGGTIACVPSCALGQVCRNGSCECDATSCPSGCCSGAACTARALSSCAGAGQACVGCDSARADRCSSAGVCQCGPNSAACATGQRCVNNACVCDSTSCVGGCCGADGGCNTPTSAGACGATGSSCSACDMTKANACSSTGACRCGNAAQCGAGQSCDGGGCQCDAASCPSGCCAGDTCTALTPSTCGNPGAACAACPVNRADSCAASGSCTCGGSAVCALGQRCVNSSCVCDATSCPAGCCVANACAALSLTTCSAPGTACVACGANRADSCTASGACRCGSGPSCGAAQTCDGGLCVGGACNSATCPSGCCNGAACQNPVSLSACGAFGSDCSACDLTRANGCDSSGSCACGSTPACGAFQRCSAGLCVCDATTCQTGCCALNVCTALTLSSCGVTGGACTACTATSSACTSGTCVCGNTGAACAAGQRCVMGACVCDPTSCPMGCCRLGACTPLSPAACAAAGTTCGACDTTLADSCSTTGQCSCGGNAACVAGQRCSSGSCGCDSSSCASGCCQSGNCTTPPTLALCGTRGGACKTCALSLADVCDAGACGCGPGPACGMGKRCVNAACSCDFNSCPTGCCDSAGDCSPPSQAKCGTGGASCVACGIFEICAGSGCVTGSGGGNGGGTGGGGAGTGGGAGAGGGSASGGSVDHLQLALINITVDAGTCTSVQLDARDATGRPVTNPGPTLDWELQPTGWVQTFANSTCAMSPATYGAGLPQVKTGYIKADKFGQSSVYPTVVNPPSGYSQGQPVAVRSMATLTGFPASLPYDVCSPITLTASAQALTDTTLNFSSPTPGASFTFNGSGCGNNVSPIIISALSSSTTGFARSNTGGTVQLFSMSGVLRFTPVAVTLTRPDAGTACLGDSIGCGAPAQCCSDVCAFGTCQGPPATP